ncbi:uncharacterized protein METZ01_LOCUS330381 [marine metagenome]|uniref:Uncharacterized protein n=1 Tax=marine metagenome TaxID=408172 RepID=A0A382PXE2_9ZZZZ
MSTLIPSKKLASILALDVVDFSMLMGETKVRYSRINSIVAGQNFDSYLAFFVSKVFLF